MNLIEKILLESEEKTPEKKIKKEIAGYVYRADVNYKCSECVFYDKGVCKLYKGDNKVKEYGSCILWQETNKTASEIPMIQSTTKKETSYTENKPGFSCKRCEYFYSKEKDCEKVDRSSPGDTPKIISPDACCNFWDGGK